MSSLLPERSADSTSPTPFRFTGDTLIGAPPPSRQAVLAPVIIETEEPDAIVARGAETTPPAALAAPAAVSMPLDSSLSAKPRGRELRLTRLAKLGVAAAILCAGLYVFLRQPAPVAKEFAEPGSQKAEVAESSLGAQMMRQTREVVAKGDANVAQLEGAAAIQPKEAAEPVEVRTAPPPSKPRNTREPEAPANLKAANALIAELTINGVSGGESPRIIVGGLLLNVNDVVDWRQGLVFAGVDEGAHEILFRHRDGAILRRRY